MGDDSTVGDRVRRLAKLRGMTQDDLRRASGLSLRTVKDVMGDHGSHRNETLHKIAKALRVRTSDLTSPGQAEHQPVPGEPWEDVRDVLYRRSREPEPGEPPTPQGVLAGLADLMPAWRANEYSQVRPASRDWSATPCRSTGARTNGQRGRGYSTRRRGCSR
jgi:transcriptional regulator with XRE-family HTH domain